MSEQRGRAHSVDDGSARGADRSSWASSPLIAHDVVPPASPDPGQASDAAASARDAVRTSRPSPDEAMPPLAKATLVWGVALVAYIIAIFCRTSLSATGIAAADQFSINASTLSAFVYLQLFVYATLQIPVGTLVDRFGPRALIAMGGLLMAAGQVLLAVSSY